MHNRNAFIVENASNNIQAPSVTLFGGYAGFPIFSLSLVGSDV